MTLFDTSPEAAAAGFDRNNTYGALVIGFAVSCVVYGILLTQAWTYFSRYQSDSGWWKFLVVLIILLETSDQAFIGHFIYFYTVTNLGNPFAIATSTMTWSLIMQQIIGSVAGTIVKCCFASRVYRFSERNMFMTGLIVVLAIGQLGVDCFFTARSFQGHTIPDVFNLRQLATISLGLGVLTDIITALSLLYFLRRLRTGYKQTDSLVTRLATDAINTGVLTSAVSLSTVLLFDFASGSLVFAATYFLLSKLYAVSFLATLNTRRVVRGRGTDDEADPTSVGRRPTTRQEQEETNMFHLGTRMPTLHENDEPYRQDDYPEFDLKPSYPPAVQYPGSHSGSAVGSAADHFSERSYDYYNKSYAV